MSGLEILGLAASVIQIAELGGKLSVQLFTFTRKVKNANKSIDALSQELASTGAVLKQLGETLTKDDHVRVCSQEAITTARGLVEDTNKVFMNLQKVILGDEKSNEKFLKGITLKQRLKFPYLENQIEQVQANLERLKSSLLVILNVLIFAEQLRNQEALPILKDQRELIKVLASEKDENEQRYKRILAAIADIPANNASKQFNDLSTSPTGSVATTSTALSTTTTVVSPNPPSPTPGPRTPEASTQQPIKVITLPKLVLPSGLQRYHEKIHHHSYLVQNLLSEIASLQYNLDLSTRDRMHNGILNMHWDEWSTYRLRHGHEHFEKMLNTHPDVASYWTDRLQDHFSRQLEVAEAVRRRQSQISSVPSITTSPDVAKSASSVPPPPSQSNTAIGKSPQHFASVADAGGDDYDSEAAFGHAAISHLGQQRFSPKIPPTLDNSQGSAESLRIPNASRFDNQVQSSKLTPPLESNVPYPVDVSAETEVRSKVNSRSANNIQESKIVPLKADQQASQVAYVIALYNFEPEADESDLLPFKKGDKIQVLDSAYKQWWRGICDGKVGLFPTNYVGVPTTRKGEAPPSDLNDSRTSGIQSQAPANMPKPQDPRRNIASQLVGPAATTDLGLGFQPHQQSVSVDAPTTSHNQPASGLGVFTTSGQHTLSAYSHRYSPDALPTFSEPDETAFVTPLRIAPINVSLTPNIQATAPRSSVSSSGSPPASKTTPTHFTKVRIRYISPEVLEWENLPWLYDPIDKDYLIIKQVLRKSELDQLSQQTQVLRNTRGDRIGATDTSSEHEVGSPKLKDSFLVVPAPLYLRFVGKLEYETIAAKKADEKSPLFVKFEVDGAKKGLLAKAKKKSVFYKITNVELTARPFSKQQGLVQRSPTLSPARGSALEEKPSPKSKEANKTRTGWRYSKYSDDESNLATVHEAIGPSNTSSIPEANVYSPGFQYQPSSFSGDDIREDNHAGPDRQNLQTEQQTYNYVPKPLPSLGATKQDSIRSYTPYSPHQSAVRLAASPNSASLSPNELRPALSPVAVVNSPYQVTRPGEETGSSTRYRPIRSYQSPSSQSTPVQNQQITPHPPDAVYQQARLSGIDPRNISLPRPTQLSVHDPHARRGRETSRLGPSAIDSESSGNGPPKRSMADRSEYQFEVDSDGGDVEDELDIDLFDQIKDAVTPFNRAHAMGQEVEAQSTGELQRTSQTSDRLDDDTIPSGKRLEKIVSPVKHTAQTQIQAAYEPAYYGSLSPPRINVSEDSKNDSPSPKDERIAKLRALNEQRLLAMDIKDEKQRREKLLQILEEMREASGPVQMQEYIPEIGSGTETEATGRYSGGWRSATRKPVLEYPASSSPSQLTQRVEVYSTIGHLQARSTYKDQLAADVKPLGLRQAPKATEQASFVPLRLSADSDSEDSSDEFKEVPVSASTIYASENNGREHDLGRSSALYERTYRGSMPSPPINTVQDSRPDALSSGDSQHAKPEFLDWQSVLAPITAPGIRVPVSVAATSAPQPKAKKEKAPKVKKAPAVKSAKGLAQRAFDIIAQEIEVDHSELVDYVQWTDLGVDSLMALTICGKFGEELNLDVESSIFTDYASVGALRKHFTDMPPNKALILDSSSSTSIGDDDDDDSASGDHSGDLKETPAPTTEKYALQNRAIEDELRRRGSVDKRMYTMSPRGKLFVAKSAFDDLEDYHSEEVLKDIEQGPTAAEEAAHSESTATSLRMQDSANFSKDDETEISSRGSTPIALGYSAAQRSWSPPSSPDSVLQTGLSDTAIEVSESVAIPLQSAVGKQDAVTELDEIDKLILQFSSLDEREYIGKYKLMAEEI